MGGSRSSLLPPAIPAASPREQPSSNEAGGGIKTFGCLEYLFIPTGSGRCFVRGERAACSVPRDGCSVLAPSLSAGYTPSRPRGSRGVTAEHDRWRDAELTKCFQRYVHDGATTRPVVKSCHRARFAVVPLKNGSWPENLPRNPRLHTVYGLERRVKPLWPRRVWPSSRDAVYRNAPSSGSGVCACRRFAIFRSPGKKALHFQDSAPPRSYTGRSSTLGS